MAWRTNKLKRSDGAEVQLYESAPEAPKAILHINHGMVEHGGRYERFASALNAAGYGAIAHDHRGHGHTTAPDAPLGTFSKSGGWQKVIGDVKAVNDHVSEHHPDIPRVIFGHSMGAILSLNYLLHHPQTVSGAILWNASVDTGFPGKAKTGLLSRLTPNHIGRPGRCRILWKMSLTPSSFRMPGT